MPCRPVTPWPLTRSTRPLGVPGATLTRTGVPSRVGTATVAPSAASAKVTGRSTVRLSPSRPNTGCLSTATVRMRSPFGGAGVALGALAAQPDLLAVLDPRGHLGGDPAALGRLQGDRGALDGVAEAQRGAGLHVGAGPRAARCAEPGERVGAAASAAGAAAPPRRTSARAGRRGRAVRHRRHPGHRSRSAPAGRRRRRTPRRRPRTRRCRRGHRRGSGRRRAPSGGWRRTPRAAWGRREPRWPRRCP